MTIKEKIAYLQVCEDILDSMESSMTHYRCILNDFPVEERDALDSYHADLQLRLEAYEKLYKQLETLALSK